MRKLTLSGLAVAAAVVTFFSVNGFASAQYHKRPMKGLLLAQGHAHHQGHMGNAHDSETAHDYRIEMKSVYEDYFAVRSALAHDSMENVSKHSKAIAERIGGFPKADAAGDMNALLKDIQTSAAALTEKGDIAAARTEFGNLSDRLVEYQKRFVSDESEKAHVFFCDMVKRPWLQEEQEIGNPYYGASMLKCGREIK